MNYNSLNLAKVLLKIVNNNPKEYQKSIDDFILFCKKTKITYLLKSCLYYFSIILKRQNDQKKFKIISSFQIDENILRDIKNRIGADNSEITESVCDNKIGSGFIVSYNNKIIDASLNENLNLLKNKIINN